MYRRGASELAPMLRAQKNQGETMDNYEHNRFMRNIQNGYIDQPAPHQGNSAAQAVFLENYRQARIMWPENIYLDPSMLKEWVCLFHREHEEDPLAIKIKENADKLNRTGFDAFDGEDVPF